jgi:hypothetical protein
MLYDMIRGPSIQGLIGRQPFIFSQLKPTTAVIKIIAGIMAKAIITTNSTDLSGNILNLSKHMRGRCDPSTLPPW